MCGDVKNWKGWFTINRQLIPIKLLYAIFNSAQIMLDAFLQLQARALGVTIEDLSFMSALMPFLGVSGSLMMTVFGDRFGYRPATTVAIIMAMASAASFEFLPRHATYVRSPMVTLAHNKDGVIALESIMSPPLGCTEDVKGWSTNKEASDGFCLSLDVEDLLNLSHHIRCENSTLQQAPFKLEQMAFKERKTRLAGNGTLCLQEFEPPPDKKSTSQCEVVGHSYLRTTCEKEVGSHTTTFISYFIARTLWKIGDGSGFALVDSLALKLADKHQGDYGFIYTFAIIPAIFAPTVGGYLVQDKELGFSDYRWLFFTSVGLNVLSLILILCFVDVKFRQPKSSATMWDDFFKLVRSPAFFWLTLMLLWDGMSRGALMNYVYIDLDENLGVTKKMIGSSGSVSQVVQIVTAILCSKAIQLVGTKSLLTIATAGYCVRLLLHGLIRSVPAYQIYALFGLDTITFSIVAANKLVYKITPPNLVATMAGVTNAIQFGVSGGLGGFLSGQLYVRAELSLAQSFIVMGASILILGLMTRIAYKYCGGQSSEHELKTLKHVEDAPGVELHQVE